MATDHVLPAPTAEAEEALRDARPVLPDEYTTLIDELAAVIDEADSQAFEASQTMWRMGKADILLGLPATILATFAGVAALTDLVGKTVAGLVALGSAAFAATYTFVDTEARKVAAGDLVAAWSKLGADAQDVRLRLEYDEKWNPDEGRKALRRINQERALLRGGAVQEVKTLQAARSKKRIVQSANSDVGQAEDDGAQPEVETPADAAGAVPEATTSSSDVVTGSPQ